MGILAVMFVGIIASELVALPTQNADEIFRGAMVVVAWVIGGMVAGVVTAKFAPRRSQTALALVGLLLGLEMVFLFAGRQTHLAVVAVGFPIAVLASIGIGYVVASRAHMRAKPPGPD